MCVGDSVSNLWQIQRSVFLLYYKIPTDLQYTKGCCYINKLKNALTVRLLFSLLDSLKLCVIKSNDITFIPSRGSAADGCPPKFIKSLFLLLDILYFLRKFYTISTISVCLCKWIIF